VSDAPPGRRLAPYLVALAIAVSFFALVESVRPYYFFQDDNRDIFVPLYLHNYRAAADGQLAQYDFYQSLGRPHYGSGQVAALHPIPYLSIFLSYRLLGHPFATADIYLFLYLLIGVAGAVYLARLLGFSSTAAVFASVAWAYTPFNMMVSQSWTTYPPVIGTLPWIIASALLLYRGRRVIGGWMFVISHLVLMYVGAPQFVLYAGGMQAALILVLAIIDYRARVLSRQEVLKKGRDFVFLILVVSGLSMPLVYPMWRHTQLSAFRSQGLSELGLSLCSISFTQLINGLFIPWYRFYPSTSIEWCGTNFPASFVHQGFLVTLLVFGYPWARKRVTDEQRRTLDAAMWVALVMVLAMMGWLTHIIAAIPVVNRFRWPFKYFGFVNLIFVMCATAAFDLLLARLGTKVKKVAAGTLLIALQMVNVTVLDLSFPSQAFFEHADPVPLREPLRERFGSGRILTLGWQGGRYTLPTVGYDYATLWELHYFGGYDPLVPERNLKFTYVLDYTAVLNRRPEEINIQYLRFWGVRWYIVTRPFLSKYEPLLQGHGMRRAFEDRFRVVFEDPRTRPLVSSDDCTTRSIGRLGDDLVATVDCARPAEVRLRFLHQKFFTVTVDDQPAKIDVKASQQMTVRVPQGVHRIHVAYDDPAIAAGGYMAGFTALAAGVVLLVQRRRKQNQEAET
jgi:hypothetical protein